MHPVNALPPITLSTSDYNNLMFALGIGSQDEGVQLLARELRRAALCHPDDLPEDVVALNCRVIYRVSGDSTVYRRLLVHPQNLLCDATEISVSTSLGAALLGLRVTDVMPYATGDGQTWRVTVEGIGMRFVGESVPRFKRSADDGGSAGASSRARPATARPWLT
jgi:regulator of nucleoside diphosphate kinase